MSAAIEKKRTINSLRELEIASNNKRSVVMVDPLLKWTRPTPAAVIMQRQGSCILMMFKRGLYLYPKKEKPKLKGFAHTKKKEKKNNE